MKAKHEKIVEILKDADDNGHLFSDTAATILEQLEPEGEDACGRTESERIAWVEGYQACARQSVPPQQPSDSAGEEVGETKAIQKQDEKYYLACQNCDTTSKPLQIIPFRNDNHVVGLLNCCDDCKDELYGQRFDREVKFKKLTRPTVSEEDILIGYVDYISELISYTALLGKELDETAMLAHAHGWRTTREVEGLAARERLNKLAKSLLLPLYTEAIKELLNR